MYRGLEGSGMRRELAWSEMMVEWGLIESLDMDTLGSGHGSRKGSCIFWFWGVLGSGEF